ncbi:MAG: phosphodiester glycosidase family protein [Candidatus Levybacteria bacterium]|nr:phosphodiester glycosidase family protein [Candidatus Levybacteria bacterium]
MFSKLPAFLEKLKIPKGKINPFLAFGIFIIVVSIIANLYLGLRVKDYTFQNERLSQKLTNTQKALTTLETQDQVVKNKKLEQEIKNIHDEYKKLVLAYEDIVDLKDAKADTDEIDELFAKTLNYLSDNNYSSASASVISLNTLIQKQNTTLVKISVPAPQNVAINNTPPGSGFSRQKVKTDFGEYIVDIVAADLNSTRVIVDTASEADCSNNCPVLSLSTYVSRNGGFAGVNGSYFCPAAYPSCVGKTNSFDTLLMNRNKVYFNSSNNVYSSVPAVIFSGNFARFVSQSLQWGRDTGVDGVIANQPLLVLDGNVVFGGDDEVKRAGTGSRSFVGSTGSTIYIGVVHSVNAAQMARVLSTMGIKNALNLDSGGSTALYSGGYKVGPGRDIPNAIVLVGK